MLFGLLWSLTYSFSSHSCRPKKIGLQPIAIQDEEDDEEENPKTMFIPSMADFEKMANAASTPFTGRGFVPDEDENTCAVNVIFKKPSVPASKSEEEIQQADPLIPLSPIMETSR